MVNNPRRAASVRRMAKTTHYDLDHMTREQAGRNRFESKFPSLIVRRIGDKLCSGAHRWHCHAGIYRTRGAHELLTRGGLAMEGNAPG